MEVRPPPEILAYAPGRRWDFFRRNRRWIVLSVLVAASAFGYWKYDAWGRPAWNRICLLFYQRQCMAYSAPATQVVLEEDPVEAATFLATGHYNREPRESGGPAVTWTASSRR